MDFNEKLSQVDWVFFDFFDTLVHRNATDDQVIERWAIVLAEELKYTVSAYDLYRYRIMAIRECYSADKSTEEIPYKVIIKRLYAMLHLRLANITFDSFYDSAYSCELKVENESLSLDMDSINKAIMAKEQGKNVGIISDFYLGTEELIQFLSKAGADGSIFKKIFVSSEYGRKKRTGNLYKQVLLELQIDAGRCLMYGDNLVSDYEMAKCAGLISCHYKYQNPNVEVGIKKGLSAIENRHRREPFSNYAFGVYYYIQQIYHTAVTRNYKKIIFLAREGYLLKLLFDDYQKSMSNKIKTEYLYVSRLSTLLPSLNTLEKENFTAVLGQYSDISLFAFLKNLQFDERTTIQISSELGIDPNKIIYGFAKSEEFIKLKNNSLFRNTYEEKRNAAVESMMGYIEPLVSGQEEIVLVDIGWKGTMQDNLSKAFNGRPIVGLYYGIFAQTGNEGNNNRKEGIVFNRFPERTRFYYAWEFETHLTEQLFAAPHGSTKGYLCDKGVYIPILEQSGDDKRLYAAVEKYQCYLRTTFEEIHRLMQQHVISSHDYFVIATKAQLRAELCIGDELLQFEQIALSERTNNFGWFATIPRESGKISKIVKMIKNMKKLYNQDGESSLMRYLSYFSIKMNAREKYRWKKYLYPLIYHIEKGRIK